MTVNNKKTSLDKWLALKKKRATTTASAVIEKMPEGVDAPLSQGQQRLWLLQELYPNNPFYNYAHRYHFKGRLDVARLTSSFQAVVQRHQILQTNFIAQEERITQSIHTEREIPIVYFDFSTLSEVKQVEELHQLIEADKSHSFDLQTDSLLKLQLIKIAAEEHILLLLIHHIIGDRASLQVLNQELAQLYQAKDLKPLAIQYTDFAYWQRKQAPKEKDLQYWLKQLAGELPILKLPTDFPPASTTNFKGKTLHKRLAPQLSQQLKNLAAQQQTTLFVLGLAAFKVLLFRYTGQTEVLVGAPFSNRDKTSLEPLIGFFNETLVLRSDLSDTPTFIALLQQLKQTTLDAFAHKSTPFDTLVQQLKPERRGTSNPIFQAMFVFNEKAKSLDFGEGLEVKEQAIDLGVSKFDLTLFLSDEGTQTSLGLEYASELFEESRIARMLDHLEVLLTSIATNPNLPISQYDLLTIAEKQQILIDWNATKVAVPKVQGIHELFEEQVATYPNNIAVAFQDTQLTYADLDAKATAVAQSLCELGDLKNRLIGLLLHPSCDILVGILGVLKAGAAYLPLDPNYPQERLEYMLADAEVAAILTENKLKSKLPTSNIPIFAIQELSKSSSNSFLPPKINSSDLAYMIYTSGSTGKPKGVPISHTNLLHSTAARFYFYKQQPSAFLLLSSFSFDSSVAGIFWTICSGGKLVLSPKRSEQDIKALSLSIAQHNISHTLLLPSLYNLLLEYAPTQQLQSLEIVMVAGEACFPSLVAQHFKKLADTLLYNEYGPTEGTVWCSAHQISRTDTEAVPIGRAIPNVSNYILDAHLQPVPIGVVGELYIGGEGIAAGYWKRPALTQHKFIPNPFGQGQLYRTGDLASFRKDGIIDFLGRIDEQIKIRGHRVELSEIQRTILQIPLVREVVVLVDQQHRLQAYVLADKDLNQLGVRHWLRTKLPDYMLPSSLIVLKEFPRLPNGKIDQKALLALEEKNKPTTSDTVEATELEMQLLAIWKTVLKTKNIGLYDNFFEIGGDSIRSIQVIAKAQQQGIKIAPNHLFEYQNVRGLAQFLSQKDSDAPAWTSIAALQKGGANTPLFCIHSGAAHVFFYRNLATYLGENQTVYALQPKGLDGELPKHDSIKAMAAYYIEEIKNVQSEGPYALLGTCFSNAVGLEMAHQLQAAGDEIETLIFVDSGPAHLQSLRANEGKKTLSRFGKMLKKGDWKAIRRKLRNRVIVAKQKIDTKFKDEQAQNLQATIDNLNKLYAFYNWKPFDGKVTFIRSTEFAARADKQFHIEQWTKLAKQGLDVHIVEGHHLTLFEEPEVQGLAAVIREVMELP